MISSVSPRTRKVPGRSSMSLRSYWPSTSWRMQGIAPVDLTDLQVDHAFAVLLRVAQPVDARDRGHDDDIPAAHQGGGGRQAQALDLLVDIGFLLDVQVMAGHVGLRLVVVVVGDKVLDRVFREELLELGVELRRQGLVVRHDQGRLLQLLDDRGHREGLTGAGGAQQDLVFQSALDAFDQLSDGFRLVAGGLEGGIKFEVQ